MVGLIAPLLAEGRFRLTKVILSSPDHFEVVGDDLDYQGGHDAGCL